MSQTAKEVVRPSPGKIVFFHSLLSGVRGPHCSSSTAAFGPLLRFEHVDNIIELLERGEVCEHMTTRTYARKNEERIKLERLCSVFHLSFSHRATQLEVPVQKLVPKSLKRSACKESKFEGS